MKKEKKEKKELKEVSFVFEGTKSKVQVVQ